MSATVLPVPQRPDVRRRHRERRAETHRRILQVARDLLEERPWSELSIDVITQEAGLSRPAFYKYFRDRKELAIALLDDLAERLAEVPRVWQEGAEGTSSEDLLRRAVDELVEAFRAHGRVLRAIAAEALLDADIAERYQAVGARLSAGVAERIAADVAAGRSTLADPAEVGTALVWMNERFLLERFGQLPLGDPERAAAALTDIWLRTVYGVRR